MDRAAFLRSLNFLRPLPPGTWDGNTNDEDEPYSGSTITPPTPSKDNVIALLEGSLFAVSIEPSSDSVADGSGSHGQQQQEIEGDDNDSRKRGRDNHEGVPVMSKERFPIGPAFFQSHSIYATKNSTNSTKETPIDVDPPENDAHLPEQDDDAGGGEEADRKKVWMINSDPSMCTFEAAIMKKLPVAAPGDAPAAVHDDDGVFFSTPNRHRRGDVSGNGETEDVPESSKALLFRFGNRFVFHVDESAIMGLTYEPGHDGEVPGDGMNSNQNGDNVSPAPKRQRNNGGGSSSQQIEKASSPNATKLPPSLLLSFGTCAFRVFSLEETPNNNNMNRSNSATGSDRIWSTLTEPFETAESRIMKAWTTLMQHFDFDNKERKKAKQKRGQSWKMASPGSGLAFHSWPDRLVEGSSFHSNPLLQCKSSAFLEEDWSHCLGGKDGAVPSTVPSPQKSTPSKTTISSDFEHGQNEHTPKKNGSSQSHSAKNGDNGKKNDDEEKIDAPNESSEITHESEQHEKDDDAEMTDGQDSLFEEPGENGSDQKATNKELDIESNKESNKNGANQLDDDAKKKELEEEGASEDKDNTNPRSWKEDIYNKYHLFETSAIHMERALDPKTQSSQQGGTSTSSHLALAAQTLSESYLTTNEFVNASQQCEDEIENVTLDMEKVLEKMFPARGRKSNAVRTSVHDDGNEEEDFQTRIEELMALRKEAVAAKLALLMTPKR